MSIRNNVDSVASTAPSIAVEPAQDFAPPPISDGDGSGAQALARQSSRRSSVGAGDSEAQRPGRLDVSADANNTVDGGDGWQGDDSFAAGGDESILPDQNEAGGTEEQEAFPVMDAKADREKLHLVLRLKRGTSLPKADLLGKSDPFVKIDVILADGSSAQVLQSSA